MVVLKSFNPYFFRTIFNQESIKRENMILDGGHFIISTAGQQYLVILAKREITLAAKRPPVIEGKHTDIGLRQSFADQLISLDTGKSL